MGPVGPCSPGIHFGYASRSVPGVTCMVILACINRREPSGASTLSSIGAAACSTPAKTKLSTDARRIMAELSQVPMPPYDALLIVSFGGPEKHEDVIPFLENVLRGRNVP